MLKKILSISGRPGLYKLISYGKNMLIVESLVDGKRMPIHARDRVTSLGDISIYTLEDDEPLSKVLDTIGKKNDNKAIDAEQYKTPEQLQSFIKDVLPNYDHERVHNSDIKKIISWYNLLVGAEITEFVESEEQEQDKKAEEDANNEGKNVQTDKKAEK